MLDLQYSTIESEVTYVPEDEGAEFVRSARGDQTPKRIIGTGFDFSAPNTTRRTTLGSLLPLQTDTTSHFANVSGRLNWKSPLYSPEPNEHLKWSKKRSEFDSTTVEHVSLEQQAPLWPISSARSVSSNEHLGAFASRIFRFHFLNKMIPCLEELQQSANSPQAARPADNLMHLILNFIKASPNDPILEILLPFHDAISVENRWAEITSAQYNEACKVLKKIAKTDNINQGTIEDALTSLEHAGFDTFPYETYEEESDFFEDS